MSPPLSPVTWLLLLAIGAYRRFVSPLLGPHCRFAPSCSAYATTALTRFGLRRGGWLALRRLSRCHPWHPGGVDPVPPNPTEPAARVSPRPSEGVVRC